MEEEQEKLEHSHSMMGQRRYLSSRLDSVRERLPGEQGGKGVMSMEIPLDCLDTFSRKLYVNIGLLVNLFKF